MQSGLLPILEILGYVLRVLGSLVFGLAAGWLAIRTLTWQRESWQVVVAVFLGLLASFVLVGNWVPGGGTLGAYGLGLGAGLLIWGLAAEKEEG
ncbi:MAG: hypothetical protein ACLFWD_00490 [Anaerolineales bacterium]